MLGLLLQEFLRREGSSFPILTPPPPSECKRALYKKGLPGRRPDYGLRERMQSSRTLADGEQREAQAEGAVTKIY